MDRNGETGIAWDSGPLRAGLRLCDAVCPRVTEAHPVLIVCEAGVAGPILPCMVMEPCIVVQWDSVTEVCTADDVATSAAVVSAEEVGELTVADAA